MKSCSRLKDFRQKWMTILLVSHSMRYVAEDVDRIIVMNKGSVLFDDVPKKVFQHCKELEDNRVLRVEDNLCNACAEAERAGCDATATTIEEAAEEIERAMKQQKQPDNQKVQKSSI